jgi:hypothetical protein
MAKTLKLPTKYESCQRNIMKSASQQKIFRIGPRAAFAHPIRC